jgi:hypothetical protein
VAVADPEVRDGWARALEASGMRVMRCAGPTVDCILLRGGGRCPLLDSADIALYHDSLLTEDFVARLRDSRAPAMIIAARDRHRMDGDHEPAFTRVVPSRV